MALNLTPKQLKILNRIRETRLTRGYSPTMQELADELGVSKVTVFEHVEALIKKGALVRQKNKARSLEVSPDLELPDESTNLKLPLVGSIAAGSPIEAIETREHLDLESLFAPPRGQSVGGTTFVLKVRGDSMIDAHISDGDFVVCRKLEGAPRTNDMVVALVDNEEATLKFYSKEKDGRVRLQPANEKYEPIWVDPDRVQFQGICVGVIRQY
ncbi:MAG: transcriptional repressor LexA [Planctomycetota bacterium]